MTSASRTTRSAAVTDPDRAAQRTDRQPRRPRSRPPPADHRAAGGPHQPGHLGQNAALDAIGATLTRHDVIIETTRRTRHRGRRPHTPSSPTAAGDVGDQDSGYQPVPAPRWWKLTGPERDTATDRLRAWVEQIYRPGYGQIAATLPPCWDQHTLCLYTLDWLSELWSFLYLGPDRTLRTLAAQAEWQTRLLPAAAEQMATDAVRCTHRSAKV